MALAPGYAANIEVASADAQPVPLPPVLDAPELVRTPGATTIDALVGQLGVPAGATMKAFPVVLDADGEMRLVVVRGDHRVNEIKLQNALGQPFRAASADEIDDGSGPPGYIGPVGAQMPVLLDVAIAGNGSAPPPAATSPAPTEPEAHLRGVLPGRDFRFEPVDVREVVAGRHRQRRRDPDRAGDRDRQHLQARARATRSPWARPISTRTASRSWSGWGATGSGRRARPPPRSSSSPTSTGSRGRGRSRRSTSSW